MDNLTSTFQNYQPIFVGAGCLAMGYMFGRHCRSMIESCTDVPVASDATCCEQNESNHGLNKVAIDQETMKATSPTYCQTNSNLKYSSKEIVEKVEKFGKRNLDQLGILEHNLQKAPKMKEGLQWAQTSTFKKQKGIPINWKELMETKLKLEQDSDDETLAQRLKYFTKSASGTGASINKPRRNNSLKITKKKKPAPDKTTYCEAPQGKEIITDSKRSLSKGTTKSFSANIDASLPAVGRDQSECSLEDTCRSPKPMCWDYVSQENVDGCQVVLTNSEQLMQIENVPCKGSKNPFSSIFEEHIKDDMSENGIASKGLMDFQNMLNECGNHLNHALDHHNEADGTLDAAMDNVASRDDIVLHQASEGQLELSISPPTEFHVQNRCMIEKQEIKEEHVVLMDKLLKVEIYELLHEADCAKVSFEQIVSLLEEKLQVGLQKDKAHIVSLVREVINISKLLEE